MRPGEQGFGAGGSARAGRRKGWGRPAFVTGEERGKGVPSVRGRREGREERKRKERKEKEKGKRNGGEEKENGKKEKGRGRVRASGNRGRGRPRAVLVTRARPGEVRHAERGGGAATCGRKREAGPSVLGRGGEGERREREKERERDSRRRSRRVVARDSGWDGGEEKERRVRSAEKGQMDTSKGIGCWKTGVWDGKEFPGIRVLGFRRISSSTLEIFLKINILSRVIYLVNFFFSRTLQTYLP